MKSNLHHDYLQVSLWSLLAEERGLKYPIIEIIAEAKLVAPRRGAWIEMVGAFTIYKTNTKSLLVEERGLK